MITGIGVALLITGILSYVVVDSFRPECAAWKRKVINSMIGAGVVLIAVGSVV